jgi:hypothetical protein
MSASYVAENRLLLRNYRDRFDAFLTVEQCLANGALCAPVEKDKNW